MNTEKQAALAAIDEKKELVAQVADAVWDYAELSMQEVKSAALFVKVLKDEGFQVEEGICGIPTAFSASFGSGGPAKASLMSFLIRVVLPAPRKPEKISILVMIQLPLSSNSTQSRRVLAQKSYTPIITRLSMGKRPFSRKNCNFFCKLAAF